METFEFTQHVVLENEAALLRPLEKTDYENLLKFSLNEPEIWKYSARNAIGHEGLRNYLDAALKARQARNDYPFIVYDKRSNQYAGCSRFYDMQLSNKCLNLGYTWYGRQFQGTGLNKNCKFLLLEFAFETLGMERVEFRADTKNERSIAAMKSIGCTVEGILRSNGIAADGARRNSVVLSILKEEWSNSVKENLRKKLRQ